MYADLCIDLLPNNSLALKWHHASSQQCNVTAQIFNVHERQVNCVTASKCQQTIAMIAIMSYPYKASGGTFICFGLFFNCASVYPLYSDVSN